MKLTRHNGRSGKHGTYNPRHNDRRFDVENSEHIDAERARQNIYWDCYRGFTTHEFRENPEQPDFSFEEIERMYYYELYSDHVEAQNARNEKTRHTERNRTVEDLLKNNKTCPEESIYQIGTLGESVSPETLFRIVNEFYEEFERRFGSHIHILDWALHLDEGTPHIHERHVFDCENRYGELCPQQESNSIKNQRALLNDYMGKHPELHKFDEYVDDGYSGTNFERPDFKRMMQDIEKRNVNCIIVKDLSRFGRNYIETGRYLERIFPFMGVRFIAINDHYDSAEENDDKGRILIPFNNLINDTYCRDISLRVRSHLDVKRKEGQFIGSFAGYGYRKDPKDKNHLIIDEYAAGIVQEIFKSKLNGMSSQRIASHLNELGVLPPNEYKRANGFNYTCGFQAGLNQKWTVVSVNRILKNESYTGTLIQGKRRKINYKVKKSHDVGSENWIRVEDAHDAIISKGEFQQVQQLLELDTRTAPSQTTVYPLSGFLRCADCGQNMIRRTVTKNGKKYQYYHCSTYKNGGGCTPHMINSEKLTESVLAAIRHQVTLLVEAEKVLSNAELASGEQIGIKILDSQITALEAELERYSNLKIRLYQDLCDDVVSREEYGEMNTRFAQKIKEAQDKIQEIHEKKQDALKHDTLLPTWLEEFKQYEHIKTLERRVVVELIDHIDVHSKTEIEIHFCFEDELHSITEKFMEYQAHHGNEVAEE